MHKTEKIFRDPLYNYVTVDRTAGEWLVELLDCREVQRLRRIHQLGVSHYTYPGADHSRLSHTLGVLHLGGLLQTPAIRIRQAESLVAGCQQCWLRANLLPVHWQRRTLFFLSSEICIC